MRRFFLKNIARGLSGPEIAPQGVVIIMLGLCLSLIISLGYSARQYHAKYPPDLWLRLWLQDISPAEQRKRSDQKHEELKRKHRQADNWEYPTNT